jgi:hypothetical protein
MLLLRTRTARGLLRRSSRAGTRGRGAALAVLGIAIAVLVCVGPASAATAPAAWWHLAARAAPTNLPPGGRALINVAAVDVGPAGVSGAGSPLTITDTLPSGLRVTDAEAVYPHRARAGQANAGEKEKFWKCTVAELRVVTCSTELAVPSYEPLEIEIPVEVTEPPGTVTTLTNQLAVQGGKTQGSGVAVPSLALSRPLKVSAEPVAFGVEEDGYSIVAETADGSVDTQAGSHPFQLTSTLDFNEIIENVAAPGAEKVVLAPAAPALAKDLSFQLPPGLLGNVTAAGRCSEVDFAAVHGETNSCPTDSVIGVATVTLLEPNALKYANLAVPVFNLEPARGEPARFGFEAAWVPVVLDANIRTDGDYGVTVNIDNATETAQVLGAQVTFWGDPGSEAHDPSRNWACLREGVIQARGETCEPPDPRPSTAFLTLPSSCDGSLATQMAGKAWSGESLGAEYAFQDGLGGPLQQLEGCAELPFDPSVAAAPVQPPEEGRAEEQTTAANTPTGLDVDVKVPQQTTLDPDLRAEADVRSATITLPQGMLLSPSAANGLQACSEQQIGYLGKGASDPFSPGTAEPLHFSTEPAQCPNASKLGTVRIKTPLVGEELQGSVYLAAQEANPFGSLVALYIVAENPVLGLRVKLAGEAQLNETTGQISTTFQDTPQVPFEDLDVRLFGGSRGSLTTPATCGSYASTGSFTPWSGSPPVAVSDPDGFQITAGPGGTPCASPLPFAPALRAGSSNLQAGAFSPFTLFVDHPDADQPLSSITMHLAPGMAAMLSSVTPCPEPQAARNQCGPESLIGHSSAISGLGGDPITLPGQVFLTGPYEGAPFGLSVVTPAVAGPFDLGDVAVRSKILIDRSTAAVTIVSDPFPTFVRGVPVQLKQLTVTVDRPGFEFNPTSCAPMSITGTLAGVGGADAAFSSPFQAANCSALPFHPTLSASTQGNASKARGASFTVKVTSGPGQANIAKTKLVLPLALPARLTTLQKACLAVVFEANPAACPEGSDVGVATVRTPVLRSPLSGPAYLVSHGNAAFPDVEFVLQGEGITLVLDGQTDIKKGITTSTFNAVPDAPVTTFETTLPEGPHSALTSNVAQSKNFNLCGSNLVMPTTITGQNGVVIQQQTKIPVLGCGAVKGAKFTRVQQLARELKKCRKRFAKNKSRRASCERKARKRYGTKKRARKPAKHRSA